MGILHTYAGDVTWTGAGTTGTTSYRAYSRDHEVRLDGKPPLLGSADPAFRGDPHRHSPEDLFVAALAQCHMLWFLHLANRAKFTVTRYVDEAKPLETPDGLSFARVPGTSGRAQPFRM